MALLWFVYELTGSTLKATVIGSRLTLSVATPRTSLPRLQFLGPQRKEAVPAEADMPAGIAENAEVVVVTKFDL